MACPAPGAYHSLRLVLVQRPGEGGQGLGWHMCTCLGQNFKCPVLTGKWV